MTTDARTRDKSIVASGAGRFKICRLRQYRSLHAIIILTSKLTWMTKEKNSLKKITRFVGVLFLVQMIAASVSHSAMLAPILREEDFLTSISTNSTTVTFAMLLDLLCGLAVFGISVLLYPILKKYNESIALWYVGLRLNEWICLMISGILLLTILSISRDFVQTGLPANSYLQALGKYLLDARGFTKILMLLGFCLSGIPFYYLLFKEKLLPRFISIWGMIGIGLLFIEVVSNIFGHSVGGILIMLPMGLNEIFLGIWLIVRGFNMPTIDDNPVK